MDTSSTTSEESQLIMTPPPNSEIASQAYRDTQELLKRPPILLAPLASVVGVRNVVENPIGDEEVVSTSLLTPNRGHHALFRALEELEGLSKQENELLQLDKSLTLPLTSLVTQEGYATPKQAVETLEALCQTVPRRVCQHPFKRNDIVWVCRTCQADETCVLCHNCFKNSNHDGHDVAFYHAQAGGCCDCGDPDAWSPEGFCPHHGPSDQPSLGPLSPDVVTRVSGVVPALVDWMVHTIAKSAEMGHIRAQASKDSTLFDTQALQSTKLLRQSSSIASETLSKAEELGKLGRQGGGLFLVIKSDDIHSTVQWVDALRELLGTSSLYTDSILQKLFRALRQYGQLVVWGSMELIAECSPTQVALWLDGDTVASGVIGAAMLSRASLLTRHGLHCSIVTLKELLEEQQAVSILQWLTCLARSCDPLCQCVAESIGPDRHLVPLLRADFKLSSRITKYWHSLLLTLLAVPTFKSHLAAAYCDTYQDVTREYARGMGVLERSGYALSVQFLNRVTYVVDLVQGKDLLGKLGKSLLETLQVACPLDEFRLNPNHFCLTHRRYSPCISDLKCVLNVKGMPRLFASNSKTFLADWLSSLKLGQFMDPQVWRDWSQGHVELESRGWVGAFNASISLGSLFERLLSWDDSDASPIDDPNSPLNQNLFSCVELTCHVFCVGLGEWQANEMLNYTSTACDSSLETYKRRPASLPFSTIAASHGTSLAFGALPMSQVTPFSFHLPLHRFAAACLREVCLRKGGIEDLLRMIQAKDSRHSIHLGLMEFPLLVLSRAAQVRAGLWRRNGPGLNDQVLNYAEPPFCRAMRDADLLLVQFSILGRILYQSSESRASRDAGSSFFVHLLLHRLGVFDFCGLNKGPNMNIDRYLQEVKEGLYKSEKQNAEMGDDCLLPWTYSPARDAAANLLLLEEFLHMIIVTVTELPPLPPNSKKEHTMQAKSRLRREVVHRLVSGPKTHSELAEVHHVLSHWDNVYLSEEGKLLNPDDATGAALGTVLEEVADRKISRGKMEPDKWELKRDAWESYDPSFFHISQRSHQTAAENRPIPPGANPNFGIEAKSLAPYWTEAHPSFSRIRRDITSDATVLAIAYRTLHTHCRDTSKQKDMTGLAGSLAYESDDRSETALAKAVHLLTLGAFAWQEATQSPSDWRGDGGGSLGSIFHDRPPSSPPTAQDWIVKALLADPKDLLASEWYAGEECTLVLLRRLAVDGGFSGGFVAQDRAVRAGAAWLCEFSVRYSPAARSLLGSNQNTAAQDDTVQSESEIEKRKRIAKQKAMERMKAQAAKFASMMETELDDDKDQADSASGDESTDFPSTPQALARRGSLGSAKSSASSLGSTSDSDRPLTPLDQTSCDTSTNFFDDALVPARLLQSRPQCIICSDDGNTDTRNRETEEDGGRKSRRRRLDGGNALAFVGYTQASTVLKGGGGPPSAGSMFSSINPVSRFVGTHVALCGHAVHSECWESYLASVSQREDRSIGKRDEFRCPLCQRLSNCLVPFIDVGVDWIESATCVPINQSEAQSLKRIEKVDDSMKIDDGVSPLSLNRFLASTPWWVTKFNKSLTWDGQCAFIAQPSFQDSMDQTSDEQQELSQSPSKTNRRSVRALRKKDLYAAWNAMMRTPRFVRRKIRSRGQGEDSTENSSTVDGPSPGVSLSDSSGETVVWRRFMDQVSDISYRADGKRLGDENLHNDFGEFRHYIVEKYSYNLANRFAGREASDWPSCVFPMPVADTQRQELSREKLLSKLLMSIQGFTYSCSSEAYEARRLIRRAISSSEVAAGLADERRLDSIYSKFGIRGIICDGKLVIMPAPSSQVDDGEQPFNGRLGRLRYLGLAVMAGAGAVAADLVQLCLQFPVQSAADEDSSTQRAAIVYPILLGHVLTHVVAALCSSGGRDRARSDSLELLWPIPFSSRGSFLATADEDKRLDSVVEDCEGFLKIGLLARTLQVLLGKIDIAGLENIGGIQIEPMIVKTLDRVRENLSTQQSNSENKWVLSCASLLQIALSKHSHADVDTTTDHPQVARAILERFHDGCSIAAGAASSFLADAGIILQVLLPGIVARYGARDMSVINGSYQSQHDLQSFEKLRQYFLLEPISEMLESSNVTDLVSHWYESARSFAKKAEQPRDATGSGLAASRLYRTQGFRVFDWPLESCRDIVARLETTGKVKSPPKGSTSMTEGGHPDGQEAVPMEIEALTPLVGQVISTELVQSTPSLVTFSAKKSVPLIGGYAAELSSKNNGQPRVAVIPTSYTDLYAELGQLLPDCEQTAVCLICGEVLNAGGKGECTRHSYKCGAGTGMFFLLQECAGLIMHNGKAAYIHSPYVDSHGETPQYRGRPLNLDMDRYEHLHEVWSGHVIRQQVLAERGSSRQIIVPDFY